MSEGMRMDYEQSRVIYEAAKAHVFTIACDYCGAAPGEPCVRPNGTRYHRSFEHAPRWWAALAATYHPKASE